MTTFTETQHWDAFIVSEANGYRSRDKGTVATGETLLPGAVVGIVTAGGALKEYNPGNSDGSEVVAGIILKSPAADTEAAYLARDAEVNASELVWFSGASAGQITAGETGLKAVGIVPRAAI